MSAVRIMVDAAVRLGSEEHVRRVAAEIVFEELRGKPLVIDAG